VTLSGPWTHRERHRSILSGIGVKETPNSMRGDVILKPDKKLNAAICYAPSF